MNSYILSLLALLGGVFLAMQGALNAQLGDVLKHPLLAAVIAFFCSTLFAFLFVLISPNNYPSWAEIQKVPSYLWFTGGLFSVLGISLYYYTIPKLGLSTMISFGLSGQLLFSLVAAHFGWFNLPVEPLNIRRAIGATAMIIGILFINTK